MPIATSLIQGVRINLGAGTYPESAVPNYRERRHGSLQAPIIVRAVDGPGTARLPSVNVFDCRDLYFDGPEVSAGGGDVVHFEASSHILLRNTTIRGTGGFTSRWQQFAVAGLRAAGSGSDITSPTRGHRYSRGAWLTFTVRFSEPVQVSGSPRLAR